LDVTGCHPHSSNFDHVNVAQRTATDGYAGTGRNSCLLGESCFDWIARWDVDSVQPRRREARERRNGRKSTLCRFELFHWIYLEPNPAMQAET